MRGRKPEVRWNNSRGQYTVTLDKKLHRLGTDRAEAERQFRFLLQKAELAEPVASNPTFGEVADAWLEHVQQAQDPERYRLCRGRINEFIAHLGRDVPVRELRPAHVEGWIASKEDLKAAGSKRLYKAMILAALNWAASARVRLIAANPLRGRLELPEGGSRGGEAVWSPETFRLVVANTNERFADLLRLLVWTGGRPSTVRKVEAKHYNAHLKVWDVEEIYRGRKSKKKYVRRIWLPPQAVELVERLNREWPEGPVVRNTKGKPYTADTVTMMLFKLRLRLKKKGIELPEGLTVYGLRHSFAHNFLVKYPDKIEYLRELLGHKDLQMIRKHYGHLFDAHASIHDMLKDFRPF